MAETEFVLLRLDAAYRERHGVPDAYVPVALPLAADLSPDALLRSVQEHAASWSGWQTLEPLSDRLTARLGRDAPPGPVLDVEGATWTLRLGPVDLGRGIVTLQRGGHLLAAVAPRPDGRAPRARVARRPPLVPRVRPGGDGRAGTAGAGRTACHRGSIARSCPPPRRPPAGRDEMTAMVGRSVACVRGARPQASGMFMVHDEAAEAIRRAFDEGGEVSAVVELRRRFPAIADGAEARRCVRTILGWTRSPDPDRERG